MALLVCFAIRSIEVIARIIQELAANNASYLGSRAKERYRKRSILGY